ncbi:hypothetical protein QYR09_08460 [Cellulophaga lytica]|nr:hypothetical protein QYR09_08460 [Cellulophaga lytica]
MKYLRVEDAINGFIRYSKIHSIATNQSPDSKIANLAYKSILKSP